MNNAVQDRSDALMCACRVAIAELRQNHMTQDQHHAVADVLEHAMQDQTEAPALGARVMHEGHEFHVMTVTRLVSATLVGLQSLEGGAVHDVNALNLLGGAT